MEIAIIIGGAVVIGLLVWTAQRFNEPPEQPEQAVPVTYPEWKKAERRLRWVLRRKPTAAEVVMYCRGMAEIKELTHDTDQEH